MPPIPDQAARRAIPYALSASSAPLLPLSREELDRLGVGAGAVKKI
ncbi:hypothetical protein [Hansschlegelia sp.]|nr:hypothetical protein [Hansschlegelia sp.]HVI28031.1 hypothetical protein [Hansschlegelia sp.]